MTATHILHLADIHIGAAPRHAEYRAVFAELFARVASIGEASRDNIICVIAGDVFHHKIKYSGEDIDLFNDLIRGLATVVAGIIIIPGNHDVNMNNLAAMDLLTPVISGAAGAAPTTLHYWRDTGSHRAFGHNFYHISVTDTRSRAEIDALGDAWRDTIFLYHGAIDGSPYSSGGRANQSTRISSATIAGAKLVIAGDIHQHQFVSSHAAYSGSLIQQNVGEVAEKGYIIWDIAERRGKFTRLHNDKGYMRVDFRGVAPDAYERVVAALAAPKELLRVTMITDGDDAAADAQKALVIGRFGQLDGVSRVWGRVAASSNESASESAAVRHDVGRSGHDLSDNIGEALREVLAAKGTPAEVSAEIVSMHAARCVNYECRKWCVLSMRWDNLFKYGAGNFIDFGGASENLRGISGVVAANRAGKSSIIDVLVFGLFGQLLRGDRRAMIHDGADDCVVRVDFSIADTKKYYIERRDDRHGHTKIALCRDDGSGWVNITEKTTTDTYRKIRDMIGTVDQFLSTGLYYDAQNDITKMTKTALMSALAEMFGLTDNAAIVKEIKSHVAALKKKIDALVRPRTCGGAAALRAAVEARVADRAVNAVARDDADAEFCTLSIAEKITIAVPLRASRSRIDIVQCISAVSARLAEISRFACDQPQDDQSDWGGAPPEEFVLSTAERARFAEIVACRRHLLGASGSASDLDTQLANLRDELLRLGSVLDVPAEKIAECLREKIAVDAKIDAGRARIAAISELCGDGAGSPEMICRIKMKLRTAESALSRLRLLPDNAAAVLALSEHVASARAASRLQFNDACVRCSENKKCVAIGLVDAEEKLAAAIRAGDEIRARNSQTSAQIVAQTAIRDGIAAELTTVEKSAAARVEIAAMTEQILQMSALSALLSDRSADLRKKSGDFAASRGLAEKISNLSRELAAIEEVETARSALARADAYDEYVRWSARRDRAGNVERLTREIAALESELADYDTSLAAAAALEAKTAKICKLRAEISRLDKLLGAADVELANLRAEVVISETYYTAYPPLLAELERYKLYLDVLGNSGLRAAFVKRNVARFVAGANDALSAITDFRLAAEIGETSVDLFIDESSAVRLPLSMGSGFQRFVAALAIRLSFTALLPCAADFVIIDEGFGCMDASNIARVADFFAHLKDRYRFVFIISHVTELQSAIERPLFIQLRRDARGKEYSSIGADICPTAAANVCADVAIAAPRPTKSARYVAPSVADDDGCVVCACGAKLKKTSVASHKKSAKHAKAMLTAPARQPSE